MEKMASCGAKEAGHVKNSSFIVALDLKRGYRQGAMAPEAREVLGARWGGQKVVGTVLPFGLPVSAHIFTRITGWLEG